MTPATGGAASSGGGAGGVSSIFSRNIVIVMLPFASFSILVVSVCPFAGWPFTFRMMSSISSTPESAAIAPSRMLLMRGRVSPAASQGVNSTSPSFESTSGL